MTTRITLRIVALIALIMLASAPAFAAVRFHVFVGPRVYGYYSAYPYPYAYGYPYYPYANYYVAPAYPNYGYYPYYSHGYSYSYHRRYWRHESREHREREFREHHR